MQNELFQGFNLIWVTVFLCMWKRQSATLAYQWAGDLQAAGDAEHPRFLFPLIFCGLRFV
jgi:hypothetical protein